MHIEQYCKDCYGLLVRFVDSVGWKHINCNRHYLVKRISTRINPVTEKMWQFDKNTVWTPPSWNKTYLCYVSFSLLPDTLVSRMFVYHIVANCQALLTGTTGNHYWVTGSSLEWWRQNAQYQRTESRKKIYYTCKTLDEWWAKNTRIPHDDVWVRVWKRFLHYWPIVRVSTGHQWIHLKKQ